MATKLEKALRREIQIGEKAYTLVIDPDGLKLTEKGHRKGQEMSWTDVLGGGGGDAPAAGSAWTPTSGV